MHCRRRPLVGAGQLHSMSGSRFVAMGYSPSEPSRRFVVLISIRQLRFQFALRQDAQKLPSDVEGLLDGAVGFIPLGNIFPFKSV